MSKEMKKTVVPRLRFPEFNSAAAWKETTIGEIGSFYYGKSAPKWSLEENAPTLCVRYGELYTKFGPVISEVHSRTNIDPQNLRFSKGGEILIPRVGEKPEDFGKCCCYLPLKNIAIGEMISVFETKQNPLFYTYYFRNMYKQFAKVVEGQNVKNLYYKELAPLPVYLTSLPEQQKIADCLSSIDGLISIQNDKIDTLKNYKKGLLQQLFPQDGETIPRLRFSEYKKSAEWKTRSFGETSELTMGFAFKSSDFVESGVQLIRMGNLYQNELTLSRNPVYLPIEFLDEFKKFQIQPNDILISMTGTAGKQDYGYAIIVPPNSKTLLLNQRVTRVRAKQETFQHFLLHAMKHPSFTSHIYSNPGGTKQANLSIGDLSEIKIALPSKNEQKKIADCLSSLDDLITAQIDELAKLEVHKKVLLQQLLPQVIEDNNA